MRSPVWLNLRCRKLLLPSCPTSPTPASLLPSAQYLSWYEPHSERIHFSSNSDPSHHKISSHTNGRLAYHFSFTWNYIYSSWTIIWIHFLSFNPSYKIHEKLALNKYKSLHLSKVRVYQSLKLKNSRSLSYSLNVLKNNKFRIKLNLIPYLL